MNKQLLLLINLQELDNEIQKLENLIKQIPLDLKKMQESYQKKQEQVKEFEQQLQEVEKDKRAKERKLQIINEELSKLHQKIYTIKTQKEMEAVDSEILQKKKDKKELEDMIIDVMIQIEELEEKLNQAREKLKKEQENYEKSQKEYMKILEESKQRLSFYKKERENIAKQVERSLLELYERLKKQKKQAVVKIVDGSCGGCFTTIPPQVINELKIGETIIRCERCVRLLYIEEDIKDDVKKK